MSGFGVSGAISACWRQSTAGSSTPQRSQRLAGARCNIYPTLRCIFNQIHNNPHSNSYRLYKCCGPAHHRLHIEGSSGLSSVTLQALRTRWKICIFSEYTEPVDDPKKQPLFAGSVVRLQHPESEMAMAVVPNCKGPEQHSLLMQGFEGLGDLEKSSSKVFSSVY